MSKTIPSQEQSSKQKAVIKRSIELGIIIMFVGLLIYGLYYLGSYLLTEPVREVVQKEGVFIEIIENNTEDSYQKHSVRYTDEEGYLRRDNVSNIKVNTELNETRVLYEHLHYFGKLIRLRNIEVEYPSIEALEADK